MYAIHLPSGEPLEGAIDFSFVLDTLAFTDADYSKLGGSYSFPARLRLTPRNTALLDAPANPARSGGVQIIKNCQVYCWGTPLFEGTLTITDAGGDQATVNFIVGGITDAKDIGLDELDLGGTRTIGTNSAEARAHAKATVIPVTPPGDYAFFPVRMDGFFEEKPAGYTGYANLYDSVAGAFVESSASPVAMPFVRLAYMLGQIFQRSGYRFTNAFQVTPALRLLYLTNNQSIYQPNNTWPTTINLAQHVTDQRIGDFLRDLCHLFGLGIFTNSLARTITLRPLRDILNSDRVVDWTAYAVGDPAVSRPGGDDRTPAGFMYSDGEDYHTTRFTLRRNANLVRYGAVKGTRPTLNDLRFDNPPAINGIYFVEAASAYYLFEAPNTATFLWATQTVAPSDPVEDTYLPRNKRYTRPTLSAAWPCLRSMHDYDPTGPYPVTAAIWQRGSVRYTKPDTTVVEQSESVKMHLVWYRGTAPGITGGDYPACSVSEYFDDGQAIYPGSLLWGGPMGLYAQYHSGWVNTLANSTRVTQLLWLPVQVLAQYQPDTRVRIGSLEYICIRLEVGKPLHTGHVEVRATLQRIAR